MSMTFQRLYRFSLVCGLVLVGMGCSPSDSNDSRGWTFDASSPGEEKPPPDAREAPLADAPSPSGTRDGSSSADDTASITNEEDEGVEDTNEAEDTGPEPSQCEKTRSQLRIGGTVSDTLPGGTGSVDETSCSSASGQEHTYSLYVPRRMDVRISTSYQNDETVFSPVLTLLEGCDADEEMACSEALSSKPDELNSLIRTTLEPGNYRLRIDEDNGRAPGEGGTYTIRTESIELADNSTCSNARVLQPQQDAITVQPEGRSSFGGQSACFSTLAYTRFYAIDVPARQTAHVTSDYTQSEFSPLLSIADSCNADSCRVDTADSDSNIVSLSNPSDTETRFYIVVENTEREPYTVDASLEPMAENAFCQSARKLSLGGAVEPVEWLGGRAGDESCKGFDVSKLFYEVDVPSGHRLFTYSGPDTVESPRVDLRDGCSASSCLEQRYVNEGDSPETVLVEAIAEEATQSSGLYAETVPVADHAECSSPKTISVGETLEDQRIRGGGELYNPCNLIPTQGGYYTLFYQVDISLGRGPVTIRAEADDPSETSLSLQVLEATQPDVCQPAGNNVQCEATHDGYRKRSPTAEVQVDGTIGGGRNPATALIAVTMAPESGAGPEGVFDLSVSRSK